MLKTPEAFYFTKPILNNKILNATEYRNTNIDINIAYLSERTSTNGINLSKDTSSNSLPLKLTKITLHFCIFIDFSSTPLFL